MWRGLENKPTHLLLTRNHSVINKKCFFFRKKWYISPSIPFYGSSIFFIYSDWQLCIGRLREYALDSISVVRSRVTLDRTTRHSSLQCLLLNETVITPKWKLFVNNLGVMSHVYKHYEIIYVYGFCGNWIVTPIISKTGASLFSFLFVILSLHNTSLQSPVSMSHLYIVQCYFLTSEYY